MPVPQAPSPKPQASIAARVVLLIAAASFVAVPAAETVRLPVTADNSVIDYRDERRINAGAQPLIRITGNQHLVVLDFDATPVAAKSVARAWLVCRQGAERIDGVSVASVVCPWDEAGSSFDSSGVIDDGWGVPGLRFPDMGGGHWYALRSHGRGELRDGWYRWPVGADQIYAQALGLSHGLSVHEFSADHSRKATIHSRESVGSEPYLEVELGGEAPVAPEPPSELELDLSRGSEDMRLHLRAPSSGFAYRVEVGGRPLPQWNVPFVRRGERQLIFLRDVEFDPARIEVAVRTLNRFGTASAAVTAAAALPLPQASPGLIVPGLPQVEAPTGVEVLPTLDKVDAQGRAVGRFDPSHTRRNAVFDGATVRLRAARGEVVSFQVLVPHADEPTTARCALGDLPVSLYRAIAVQAGGRRIFDPLIALEQGGSLPREEDRNPVVVDVAVPRDESRATVTGSFELGDGTTIPIELTLRPFALPAEAAIRCEMNSYGLPDSVDRYLQLQRLAHRHRVHANILPYGHASGAEGTRQCVMDMRLGDGRRMDEARYNAIEPGATTTYWDDFVTAFDPVLSGRAFAGLGRGELPVPGFYLTFHESWPLKVRSFFDGTEPDAYAAFRARPVYRETFVALLRDFDRLAGERGWDRAGFQIYLNNKGILDDPLKAPWVLDEPASYWDYRALNFYGDLVAAAGVGRAKGLRYRIDISRPQYTRGQLTGRGELWVVSSGAFDTYARLLADRRAINRTDMWVYGTTNAVVATNRETQAWVLWAFAAGATGVVPWQTVSKDGRALETADQQGLFIWDGDRLHHSLRLKAYRRAEQDVAYLKLLQQRQGWSHAELVRFMARYLSLQGELEADGAEDAGSMRFAVDPERFRQLREAAASLLGRADQGP